MLSISCVALQSKVPLTLTLTPTRNYNLFTTSTTTVWRAWFLSFWELLKGERKKGMGLKWEGDKVTEKNQKILQKRMICLKFSEYIVNEWTEPPSLEARRWQALGTGSLNGENCPGALNGETLNVIAIWIKRNGHTDSFRDNRYIKLTWIRRKPHRFIENRYIKLTWMRINGLINSLRERERERERVKGEITFFWVPHEKNEMLMVWVIQSIL